MKINTNISRLFRHPRLLAAALALAWAGSVSAQTVTFGAQPGGKVRVDGTSSIHDWDMNGNIIGGELQADAKFPAAGADKATGTAFIPVRTLKSYAKKMDEVMAEAMDMAKFPRIEYKILALKPKSNEIGRAHV